ncbi:hypothetical protein LshimejAT787_1800600 [Lyophyllum shimeji]|uniref:Uncharacterized protein n=1 Tax=Lyophyllum shimeji TaxID=47721 RepID=A0A9P3UTL1_LYOSH|nr:hypothetical protein LshimejAT787_1800600 [Lyophyllum shimeji]
MWAPWHIMVPRGLALYHRKRFNDIALVLPPRSSGEKEIGASELKPLRNDLAAHTRKRTQVRKQEPSDCRRTHERLAT